MQSAADNEVEIVSVQPGTEVTYVDSDATSNKRRKITDFFPTQASTQRDSVTVSAIERLKLRQNCYVTASGRHFGVQPVQQR